MHVNAVSPEKMSEQMDLLKRSYSISGEDVRTNGLITTFILYLRRRCPNKWTYYNVHTVSPEKMSEQMDLLQRSYCISGEDVRTNGLITTFILYLRRRCPNKWTYYNVHTVSPEKMSEQMDLLQRSYCISGEDVRTNGLITTFILYLRRRCPNKWTYYNVHTVSPEKMSEQMDLLQRSYCISGEDVRTNGLITTFILYLRRRCPNKWTYYNVHTVSPEKMSEQMDLLQRSYCISGEDVRTNGLITTFILYLRRRCPNKWTYYNVHAVSPEKMSEQMDLLQRSYCISGEDVRTNGLITTFIQYLRRRCPNKWNQSNVHTVSPEKMSEQMDLLKRSYSISGDQTEDQ